MSNQSESTIQVTAAELVARARALIPTLRERALEDARERCVRAQTVAQITEAGLLRVLVPKRWGGYEMDLSVWADVLLALGEGDLGASWIAGVYAGHAFHLGHMNLRAQEDVWGSNVDARIVSPYAPQGRATPVPGGFRLSGHWSFSSGCMHSNWAMLGGISTEDPRDARVFLIPRKDYEIVDTWSVMGLESTGSHDLDIKDAFVPEYRTHRFIDMFTMMGMDPSVEAIPLYRVPYWQIANRTLSTGQIGALKAMVDIQSAQNAKRLGTIGRAAVDPDAQYACAEAYAGVEEMTGTLHRTLATLMEYARANQVPSERERLLFRYQSAEAADRCVRLATGLLQTAGGGVIYHSNPLGLIYRNLIAARGHVGNNVREMGRRLGSVVLGSARGETDIML